MIKLMFAPVKLLASRLASLTGKRALARVWGTVGKGERPSPADSRAGWGRLLAGLALEGAILRLASGAFDHASRRWFARVTGRWPGPGQQDPPAS
jgi:hypothetical protein